jgi:hypothetical protein
MHVPEMRQTGFLSVLVPEQTSRFFDSTRVVDEWTFSVEYLITVFNIAVNVVRRACRAVASYLGLWGLLWVSQGQCFLFVALVLV